MNRLRLLIVALTASLVAAACGGGSDLAAERGGAGATPVTVAEAGASDLPAVDVFDLATGDTVNVATLAPAANPLLVWFWAPH